MQKAAREENAAECGRVFSAICKLQWENIYLPDDAMSVIEPEIAAEMDYGNEAASRAARLPRVGR